MFGRYSRVLARLALTFAALTGSTSLAPGASIPIASPSGSHAELAQLARIAAETPGPWRQVVTPGMTSAGLATDLAASALAHPASLATAVDPREPGPDLWQPGFGLPSIHEYPSVAIEFRGELIISGWLRSAGGVKVNGIARWTTAGWQPLGEGVTPAFALAVYEDRLIAGGWIGDISSWDGRVWTTLPKPPINMLDGLFVMDGKLYAAGLCYPQTGVVARLDGSEWTVLGGLFNDRVVSLGAFEGRLIAGGRFTSCAGSTVRYVAGWDGTNWTALGAGIDAFDYAVVQAIQEFDGRLVVGGLFASCSGEPTNGLASFDGTAWHALPGNPSALVYDLAVADQKLWVAGYLYSPGWYSSVKSFDGSTWDASLEPLNAWALGLATWGGRVVVAGGFDHAGAGRRLRALTNLAVLGDRGWEGFESWKENQHGLAMNAGAAMVQSAVVYKGDLVVSGIIRLAGSANGWKSLGGVGAWNGHEWSGLGDQIVCGLGSLAVVGNDLVLAGILSGNSEEGPLVGAARWDGSQWHPMGELGGGLVRAACGYRGSVYVGGEGLRLSSGETTTLARWDGSEWHSASGAPSGALYNTARVNALVIRQDRLVVGGNFTSAGGTACGGVAEWDGSGWSALGDGPGGDVQALAIHRGDLYASGALTGAGPYTGEGVKRWKDGKWAGLGLLNTQVTTLASYANRLVIGGLAGTDRFVPGSLGLVAYDDGQWTGFGTGLAGTPFVLCQWGGDLVVAGEFDHAGGVPAFSIARWAGGAPTLQPPSKRSASVALTASTVTSNETTLRYHVPAAGHVRLEVYGVNGARVATLIDREVGEGDHELVWGSGSPAPLPKQGIYFLRLRFENLETVSKLVVAR